MIFMDIKEVLDALDKAKDPKQSYGGSSFNVGYHTLKLRDKVYKGQRNNTVRLSDVDFDFKDKSVLDLGCNVGGMLHELSPIIQYGVGVDYNIDCINAANAIRDYNGTYNIHFYQFDLCKQPIEQIRSFVMEDKIDICFFLSMIMWIKNWRDVLNYLKLISNYLLIELNGDNQDVQLGVVKTIYSNVSLIYDKSLDDPGQHNRKLYICNDI